MQAPLRLLLPVAAGWGPSLLLAGGCRLCCRLHWCWRCRCCCFCWCMGGLHALVGWCACRTACGVCSHDSRLDRACRSSASCYCVSAECCDALKAAQSCLPDAGILQVSCMHTHSISSMCGSSLTKLTSDPLEYVRWHQHGRLYKVAGGFPEAAAATAAPTCPAQRVLQRKNHHLKPLKHPKAYLGQSRKGYDLAENRENNDDAADRDQTRHSIRKLYRIVLA